MATTDAFQIDPEKAKLRVNINSAMIGVLFIILTFILTFGQNKFNALVLAQLVLAIPFLYASILAYSKVAYWKRNKQWDSFGWITSNLANNIILNAIGLIVASFSIALSVVYFGLIAGLMIIYSKINITLHPKLTRQKIYKFLFFIIVLLAGGIIPLLFSLI